MAAIDITPRHHFVQPRQSRRRHAYHFGLHLCVPPELNPDSPDEMAFGQLRASNLVAISDSYAGSSSRILTDPTGERRNRQFRQRFRGLRSCRPNRSGESGFRVNPREIMRRDTNSVSYRLMNNIRDDLISGLTS